jgi:hypothetical protein
MARKKISGLPTIAAEDLSDTTPVAAVNLEGTDETVKLLLGQIDDYVMETADAAFLKKTSNLSDLSDKEAATGNLLFSFLSSEAVARSVTEKLRDNAVNVLDFGAVGDAAVDDGPAFQEAFNYALSNRKNIYVPGYPYIFNIETTVTSNPVPLFDEDPRPAYYPGAIANQPTFFGDGMAASIILPRVPGAPAFDFNVTDPDPYAYRAAQGLNMTQLCFIGSNAVSGAIAMRIFNAYQAKISQIHVRNMSGSGVQLINGVEGTVPDSGWNMVNFDLCWFEGNANDGDGWAFDATGNENRNEGSFTYLKNCFFQGNGRNQYYTITGITNANPAVVTVTMNQIPATSPVQTTHGFVEGDRIKMFGVEGMTEVNDVIYTVGPSPTATTFSLYTDDDVGVATAINSTAYGVFKRYRNTLAASPIAVTNGSPTVTVTMAGHPFRVGQIVTMAGLTATGGITPNGNFVVTTTADGNTFTYDFSSNATSTATGGGSSATAQKGLLGTDPFATTSGSTTVVVTQALHGRTVNDIVTISGASTVGGLTLSGEYRITALGEVSGGSTINSTTKFRIEAASAASSTIAGGGSTVNAIMEGVADHAEVGYYIPKSGALRWKGQLIRLDQCGFTVNQNCATFIKGQAGLGVGFMASQVSWENSYRRHVFCTGITNFYSVGSQFHGNDSYRQWRLVEFDTTDFVAQNILWQNTKVRARLGYGTAFKFTGSNIDLNSARIKDVTWDDFDYYTQKRFDGVPFDQIEQCLSLIYTSTTLVSLKAIPSLGKGNKTPLRLQGPNNQEGLGVPSLTGEWVSYQPTSINGVSSYNTTTGLSGGPALAASTMYNMYLKELDGAMVLYPSTDSPTIDNNSGYMVRTGDAASLYVGRAKTDAGLLWEANSSVVSQSFWNPTAISGNQSGVPAWMWHNSVDNKIWVKAGSAPTSGAGGTDAYWASYESSKTFDFGAIAAGGIETTTLTSLEGVSAEIGDYVTDVAMSIDTGGLILSGRVSASNVITITAYNPTGGSINLGPGTLRAIYQRR